MSKKPVNFWRQFSCIPIILGSFLLSELHALSPGENDGINYFEIPKKFRVETAILAGGGIKELSLFKTTENDIVKLSAGGGLGAKLGVGYYLTSRFNLNLEFGVQNSTLSQELKNADGDFFRIFILGSLRYQIPVSSKSAINIGAGAGYYLAGELDIDASQLENGGHNIYKYENTTGIHILAEFERFIPGFTFLNANWSWSLGLKYYSVTYNLDSATSDGITIPIAQIPDEIKSEVEEMDGSGVDLLFALHLQF